MSKRSAGAAMARAPKGEFEMVNGRQVRKRRGVAPSWMGGLKPADQETAQRLLDAGWNSVDGALWNHQAGFVGLDLAGAAKQAMPRGNDIEITEQGPVETVEEDLVKTPGPLHEGETEVQVKRSNHPAVDEINRRHAALEAAGWTSDHGAWKSPKGRIFTGLVDAFNFQFPDGVPTFNTPSGKCPVSRMSEAEKIKELTDAGWVRGKDKDAGWFSPADDGEHDGPDIALITLRLLPVMAAALRKAGFSPVTTGKDDNKPDIYSAWNAPAGGNPPSHETTYNAMCAFDEATVDRWSDEEMEGVEGAAEAKAGVDAGEREDGDATLEADRAAAAVANDDEKKVAAEAREAKARQTSQEEIRERAIGLQADIGAYNTWLGSPLTAGLRDWAKTQMRKRRQQAESRALKPKQRDESVIELSVLKELMGELHKPMLRARALKKEAEGLGDLFASTIELDVQTMDVDDNDLPDDVPFDDDEDGDADAE